MTLLRKALSIIFYRWMRGQDLNDSFDKAKMSSNPPGDCF